MKKQAKLKFTALTALLASAFLALPLPLHAAGLTNVKVDSNTNALVDPTESAFKIANHLVTGTDSPVNEDSSA